MYSYLTGQLAGERQRARQAEQCQAQAAALARSSRRPESAPGRRVRWAARKVLWLRSEPQR